MAGHSKRHNIKHKKARSDAAKAKVYAKISKLITMAAKEGGDPSLNPALDTVLQKAKANSLPKHVIDKAIEKGSGGGQQGDLEHIYYEGYGPGGVALLIHVITDNANRASASIRALLTKMGGSMGAPGSVQWLFDECGVVIIDGKIHAYIDKGQPKEEVVPYDADTIADTMMDFPIRDIYVGNEAVEIETQKEDFFTIVRDIRAAGYHIADASLDRLPTTTIAINESDIHKLRDLLEMLDDNDDVDTVFHNALLPEELFTDE